MDFEKRYRSSTLTAGFWVAVAGVLTWLASVVWQISGRADTDVNAMIRLDFYYVQRWSLFLDVDIILKTVLVTLKNGRASLSLRDRDGHPATLERRTSFGAVLLSRLPDGGLTFDEAAQLAAELHGALAHEVVEWLGRLARKGWLVAVAEESAEHTVQEWSPRFTLHKRAHEYLVDDPRVEQLSA